METRERKRNFLWAFKPVILIENILGCASMNISVGEIQEASTFQTNVAKLLLILSTIPMMHLLHIRLGDSEDVTIRTFGIVMHLLQFITVTHIYYHAIAHKSNLNKLYQLLYEIDVDLGIFDRTKYVKLFLVNCSVIVCLVSLLSFFTAISVKYFLRSILFFPAEFLTVMVCLVSVMRLVSCVHFLALRSEEVFCRLKKLCDSSRHDEDLGQLYSAFSKICEAVRLMEPLLGQSVFLNVCVDFVGSLLNNLVYFQIHLKSKQSTPFGFMVFFLVFLRHAANAALTSVACERFFDKMNKCKILSYNVIKKYENGPERQVAKKIHRMLAVRGREYRAGGLITLDVNFLMNFVYTCLLSSVNFTIHTGAIPT